MTRCTTTRAQLTDAELEIEIRETARKAENADSLNMRKSAELYRHHYDMLIAEKNQRKEVRSHGKKKKH